MNNGRFTRRAFIGVGGAFALLNGGCAFRAPSGLFGGGGANIRFGVISDVHIQKPGDEEHLLKALEFFRERGADGVRWASFASSAGSLKVRVIFPLAAAAPLPHTTRYLPIIFFIYLY